MNIILSTLAMYGILGVILVIYITLSISNRTNNNFVKRKMTMGIGLFMFLLGIVLGLIYFV